MSLQFELDWNSKLPPSAQEGMAQALDHADKFWLKVLDGCILAVARKLPELSVDNVLDELEEVNKARESAGKPIVETHHLCAIGPAMRRAQKDGIIVGTGRVVRSKKAHKNGNIHSLWASNFYGGKK
jgi:hypothetical protein